MFNVSPPSLFGAVADSCSLLEPSARSCALLGRGRRPRVVIVALDLAAATLLTSSRRRIRRRTSWLFWLSCDSDLRCCAGIRRRTSWRFWLTCLRSNCQRASLSQRRHGLQFARQLCDELICEVVLRLDEHLIRRDSYPATSTSDDRKMMCRPIIIYYTLFSSNHPCYRRRAHRSGHSFLRRTANARDWEACRRPRISTMPTLSSLWLREVLK